MSDPIRLVDLHELVGRSEIAKRSGARLQTVDTWRRRYADFPTPVGTISGTPLWLWSDVERWINETPREVGRPSSRRTPATPIAPLPDRFAPGIRRRVLDKPRPDEGATA